MIAGMLPYVVGAFIGGLLLGTTAGVLIMCMMIVGGEADDRAAEMLAEYNEPLEGVR